jgi:hypothetical protein
MVGPGRMLMQKRSLYTLLGARTIYTSAAEHHSGSMEYYK